MFPLFNQIKLFLVSHIYLYFKVDGLVVLLCFTYQMIILTVESCGLENEQTDPNGKTLSSTPASNGNEFAGMSKDIVIHNSTTEPVEVSIVQPDITISGESYFPFI